MKIPKLKSTWCIIYRSRFNLQKHVSYQSIISNLVHWIVHAGIKDETNLTSSFVPEKASGRLQDVRQAGEDAVGELAGAQLEAATEGPSCVAPDAVLQHPVLQAQDHLRDPSDDWRFVPRLGKPDGTLAQANHQDTLLLTKSPTLK